MTHAKSLGATCAGGVEAAQPYFHRAGGGGIPTPALHNLQVSPIPTQVAKELLEREQYLHSSPGGTHISLGVFLPHRLQGVITLGAGPYNSPSLVEGGTASECLTLTRLWLSDELPRNSESRVLGVVLRALKRQTELKFLVTYADPSQGHVGTIYQATGWLYTGLSEPTPLYDLGEGKTSHGRTVATRYGSRSIKYLRSQGLSLKLIPQDAKHRYIYFLDPSWRDRLRVEPQPYPKSKESHATD